MNKLFDPVYTMPVEFENGIKKDRFALPFTRCRQNFHILPAEFFSVSKTASCKRTLPAAFYVAFVTRLRFLILPIVLIVVVVLSILSDF